MGQLDCGDRTLSAEFSDDCSCAVVLGEVPGHESPDDGCCYINAADCPDCGAGMIRQGLCFYCPLCGFDGCYL